MNADPRSVLLTAIADDELVTGHRWSHWTGFAPSLEEDLAFSTLAQDEINHADLWYQVLLAGPGGDPATVDRAAVDALGLGRPPDAYRHAVLCERPPGDFLETLVRQFLYDHFDAARLEVLSGSADPTVAAVAGRLRHEERYHLEHAVTWITRIARGGSDAHERLAAALRAVWPEALWLAEPLPGEQELVAAGVLPEATDAIASRWLAAVIDVLEAQGLADTVPATVSHRDGRWHIAPSLFDRPGGRHGMHTADWTDDAWPEMTALYRSDPEATW